MNEQLHMPEHTERHIPEATDNSDDVFVQLITTVQALTPQINIGVNGKK